MKTKHIFYLTLIICHIFCTWINPDYAAASAAPGITSVHPSPLSAGVDVDTVITVIFSEEMNTSTINTDTFFVTTETAYGYATVPGSVIYSGKTATFIPESSLVYGKDHSVTITKDVRKADGNLLGADYTWNFTTKYSYTITEITSVHPPHLSAGVDTDTVITVIFSEEMNKSTINTGTFFVKTGTTYEYATVPGSVIYSNKRATFTPESSLGYGEYHMVTITKEIRKADGSFLESDYTWIFTTERSVSSLPGDMDQNGKIDLKDAILVLKLFAGISSTNLYLSADLNKDNQIGMEEVIYILQKISLLRAR